MNIKFNNETIKNAIMDALDKMERGIEISEVDRNELIDVILKGDRDFGIKNDNRKYTKEELQCSIYIHIFKNDKCYIGQTSVKPERRWGSNGSGYCKGQAIYKAIKKYGWDNVSHVVLCHGLTQEEVDKMEVALISLFKSNNREFGYNIANGGNSVGKHSEETIKKIAKTCKGKYVGENNNMYGKQHSEESKNKMSEAKKGEKHNMYGKHHSEESKNKIAEARKGKYVGEKHHNAKQVFCDGKIFTTVKEWTKVYNVNYSTVKSWLGGRRKMPHKFIELGLRYATQYDIDTYPLYIEE